MGNETKGFEFKTFATPRIIGGIAIVIIVLWALSIIFGSSEGPASKQMADRPHDPAETASHSDTTDMHQPAAAAQPSAVAAKGRTAEATGHGTTADQKTTDAHDTPAAQKAADAHETAAREHADTNGQVTTGSHGTTTSPATNGRHETPTGHPTDAHGTSEAAAGAATTHQPATAATHDAQTSTHGTSATHTMPTTVAGKTLHQPKPKGVAFVEAIIQPLHYELEERWWGWRPNDIIDLTDNVNNFQMGVLEVTRRATVALAERISRTGTTDAFDENLEQAMNWFMIKASSYWFPSAESKYRDGLEELQAYLEKLNQGNATFYTRTDNLIPLLTSFEDLLGSCDENLVKQVNEDGTPVSSFAVDNYFFYSQGVASSMATVLEAVHHDFLMTLESRNATELLHHAIISCQKASEIDPWLILNSDYDSVFANHRANMAAPISHAYFYIRVLIKSLST